MKEARDCAEELNRGILNNRYDELGYRFSGLVTVISNHMRMREAKLLKEIRELKNHCNTVWGLVRQTLPFCPSKMRRMIEVAAEDGKKLRAEGTHRETKLMRALEKITNKTNISDIHWIAYQTLQEINDE